MTDKLFTILLVEDNPSDVYIFRYSLNLAAVNCEIIVLTDGEMAIQFFRRQGKYAARAMPDLVVMDCRLPRCDGIEVLRALRQSDDFADLPIVITSSSIDLNLLLEMERLGIRRYFDKPSTLEGFSQICLVLKQILLESQGSATAAVCAS